MWASQPTHTAVHPARLLFPGFRVLSVHWNSSPSPTLIQTVAELRQHESGTLHSTRLGLLERMAADTASQSAASIADQREVVHTTEQQTSHVWMY